MIDVHVCDCGWSLTLMPLYPEKTLGGKTVAFTTANTLRHGMVVRDAESDNRLRYVTPSSSGANMFQLYLPTEWYETLELFGKKTNAGLLPVLVGPESAGLWNVTQQPCTGLLRPPYDWAKTLYANEYVGNRVRRRLRTTVIPSNLWWYMLLLDTAKTNMASPEGFSASDEHCVVPEEVLELVRSLAMKVKRLPDLMGQADAEAQQKVARNAVLREIQLQPWVLSAYQSTATEKVTFSPQNAGLVQWDKNADSRATHTALSEKFGTGTVVHRSRPDRLLTQKEAATLFTPLGHERAGMCCPRCQGKKWAAAATTRGVLACMPFGEHMSQSAAMHGVYYCRRCKKMFLNANTGVHVVVYTGDAPRYAEEEKKLKEKGYEPLIGQDAITQLTCDSVVVQAYALHRGIARESETVLVAEWVIRVSEINEPDYAEYRTPRVERMAWAKAQRAPVWGRRSCYLDERVVVRPEGEIPVGYGRGQIIIDEELGSKTKCHVDVVRDGEHVAKAYFTREVLY